MKTLLLLLILNIGFGKFAKADTINFWHVYYNNIKIEELNEFSKGSIEIKIRDVKPTDSLIVKYFRDTPCSECQTILAIENKENTVIVNDSRKGTFCPLKISVYDLLNAYLKNKEIYNAFYLENPRSSYMITEFLFTIVFK